MNTDQAERRTAAIEQASTPVVHELGAFSSFLTVLAGSVTIGGLALLIYVVTPADLGDRSDAVETHASGVASPLPDALSMVTSDKLAE